MRFLSALVLRNEISACIIVHIRKNTFLHIFYLFGCECEIKLDVIFWLRNLCKTQVIIQILPLCFVKLGISGPEIQARRAFSCNFVCILIAPCAEAHKYRSVVLVFVCGGGLFPRDANHATSQSSRSRSRSACAGSSCGCAHIWLFHGRDWYRGH